MYPTDTLMIIHVWLCDDALADWGLTLLALIPLPFVSYAVYRLGQAIHQKFEVSSTNFPAHQRAQENLSGSASSKRTFARI